MYLKWGEETITDFSETNIERQYSRGFVFTRLGKGIMRQTRSVRVHLPKFKLSSENKRILKKIEGIEINAEALPMEGYDWKIGKLAKDFYDKFGEKTFSANKIKEIMTDKEESNFNALLSYDQDSLSPLETKLGYSICYAGSKFTHYCYPFYNLSLGPKDMGLAMMIMAIMLSQEQGDEYIYLGSASRPSDTYKLQFDGLEWFDRGTPEQGGGGWKSDYSGLKTILKDERV